MGDLFVKCIKIIKKLYEVKLHYFVILCGLGFDKDVKCNLLLPNQI